MMAYLEYSPRTPLYHYTSELGFQGMATNGALWLTDLQYANDPKELQLAHAIPKIMEELSTRTQDEALQEVYFKAANELIHVRSRFGLYSFSLSLKSDKLPMWQEYTDRGRGYCIQFRATTFNQMPLRIQRVKYVDPNYFNSLHTEIETLAKPLLGVRFRTVESIIKLTSFLTLMSSVKNDIWEHEDEVRLIFSSMATPKDFKAGETVFPVGLLPDGTGIAPEEPAHRERGGELVPYFSKQFGRYKNGTWDASRSFERIILGCNNERDEGEVEQQLRGLGYQSFTVERSNCLFKP